MRGTEAAKGRRRRYRGWKAASVLLLGLMSGSTGCRSTGDPATVESVMPPAEGKTDAVHGQSVSILDQTVPVPNPVPGQVAGNGNGIELVQTSFRDEPEPPRPEEQGEVKEQGGRKGDSAKEPGYRVDLTLPSPAKGMATPVIPPPQKVLPLTLAESLAVAGAANPVIALAQQAVRLSRIEQFQARLLLVPNINVGADYDLNNGPVQASFGAIRKVDRQSVLYGLGTYSVVAETVKIPGLFIFTPLTDAFFNPLVARQIVANRRFAAAATNNQVLLEVSTAYLDLLGAEARLAVIRQSEADFNEVVRLTGVYAKARAGRDADANRAQADLLAVQYAEQQAQEEVAVAAANLARLLNLDPSVRLQTGIVPIQIVTFVDPNIPLPRLLEVAANNRPEVLAAAAAIRASQIRVRQEKTRPLLPTIWAGFSADDFGGGAVSSQLGNVPNSHTGNITGSPDATTGGQTVPKFGRINGRTDVDVIFIWTLQNAGLGNLANIRGRRAELNQSYAERLRILNEVNREVAEAYNTSAQQFLAIGIERRRVQEVSRGFQLDLERIREQRRARPIEVLDQAKRLYSARLDLLAAIIGFDRAQFQLFVSLGQPPNLVVEDDKTAPPLLAAELPPPNVRPPQNQ